MQGDHPLHGLLNSSEGNRTSELVSLNGIGFEPPLGQVPSAGGNNTRYVS